MTEIKIPFLKTEVKKIVDDNKPANAEGLELEISTSFRFDEVYEKVPLNRQFTKMKLGFFDGAEKIIYNNLLDDDKTFFELSFEKEKVDFFVLGEEERSLDDTKLTIDCFPADSVEGDGKLEILFKPQFAGVVKITSASQNSPGKPNKPTGPQVPANDQKKIDELQAQIDELEEKLKNQPNSPTNQNQGDRKETEKKIKRLKEELDKIKNQKNPQQPSKNGSSYLPVLVIGGGIIVLLVIIILVLALGRSRDRNR